MHKLDFFFLLLFASSLANAGNLYVSPQGNDSWTGNSPIISGPNGPVATLARAQGIVREIKTTNGLPPGGITVNLASGTYRLTQTFSLTSADSGSVTAPIVYKSSPGSKVYITGSKIVNGFTLVNDASILARLPVAARGKVYQATLTSSGITATDYGVMSVRGMNIKTTSHGEFFYKKGVMQLARWPNTSFSSISSLPSGSAGDAIIVNDAVNKSWSSESDIWVSGYWNWDWADKYLRVTTFTPSSGKVTLGNKSEYGMKQGQRIYFINVLAELDTPGEWYLNRNTGILYFWPPSIIQPGDVEMSALSKLVDVNGASYIDFDGLTFEMSRGPAVTFNNSNFVRILNSDIRNNGNNALTVKGGLSSGLRYCKIYDNGDGGVILDGGDRTTLASANLFATNTSFSNNNRWTKTYAPAIKLQGVGNRVANNVIKNAPHVGIVYWGNNHLIELNDISYVLSEASDAGVIYTGRDWTDRGNIIRYNYIHNIIPYFPNADVRGIYIDDQSSGNNIFGNIFYKVSDAVWIGGGRDNVVENNIFVDTKPSLGIDARGAPPADNSALISKLKAVPYQSAVWSSAYPTLPKILNDDPGLPKYTVFRHNVSYGAQSEAFQLNATQLALLDNKNNWIDKDVRFLDATHLTDGTVPIPTDFTLASNAVAYSNGFKLIPFDRIGINGSLAPLLAPQNLTLKP